MPFIILLPDGQNNVSSDWVLGGSPAESTVHDSLNDNNGDTSFVACDDALESMIIEFANPSVVEAGIDFNETVSVRFLSSGRSSDRRNASEVVIKYQVPLTTAYDEICSYDAHASSYESINGTARTTSDDGSTDWTYADLQNLEMKCIKSGTQNIQLSYLALRVDYTAPTAAVDNATFFGANF